MFGGLKQVVLQVTDIGQAKDWYSKAFNIEPIIDSHLAVVFKIEDSELILKPNTTRVSQSNDNAIAFWKVANVELEYNRLIQQGAKSHTEIKTVFGAKRATLVDPFGNIFGITGTPDEDGSKSVTEQPSKTALGTAFLRALAVVDDREEIRGQDYLAELFLTEEQRNSLKSPALMGAVFKKRFLGMYEYLMTRTAYFDSVVKAALNENIPQIVLLGAGYDTRAYRFKDDINDTKIFELDIHTTQERKKAILDKAGIPIPRQLRFVSIDFNTDNFREVLDNAGFNANQKTLFIWEGVTYYLSAGTIDDTLSFIRFNSPDGSRVVFDYATYSPAATENDGVVNEAREIMKSKHSGEPIQFAIKTGELEAFLAERGYQLIELLTAEEMERKYLILSDGSLAGKVLPSMCIASAAICGEKKDKEGFNDYD
jgi:methyltransferase (TIGR00027 family)